MKMPTIGPRVSVSVRCVWVVFVAGCTDPAGSVYASLVDPEPSNRDGVVQIDAFNSRTERFERCTGSLIAPRLVLTARHCRFNPDPNRYRVEGGSWRAYVEALLEPAHSSTTTRDGTDVLLMVLRHAVPSEPIRISFAQPRQGEGLLAVGFGVTPNDAVGGNRLEQWLTVSTALQHVPSVHNNLIFTAPGVCSGDSGGPLLDSQGALVGVASFIQRSAETPACSQNTRGAFVHLAPFESWLREHTERLARNIDGGTADASNEATTADTGVLDVDHEEASVVLSDAEPPPEPLMRRGSHCSLQAFPRLAGEGNGLLVSWGLLWWVRRQQRRVL